MKRRFLPNTDIEVSELCFGTLTLGPLQKNLSPREALPVLRRAHERGINFFDTADMYNTYGHLRELVKIDPEIVICTRSYDYTAEGLNKSLERALRETGRDYIDLYLLHEQESRHTFRGHWEAIEALLRAKERGLVKEIGISTHRIEAVRDSLDFDEIKVLFALINKTGLGIEDGSRDEMLEALERAREKEKVILGMKPLGGGNLIKSRDEALSFAKKLLSRKKLHSVALGMQSIDEVDFNIDFFEDKTSKKELAERLSKVVRRLHIDSWCEGCRACEKKCHQGAIHVVDGQAQVEPEKCLTCGYCASVCPVFAIKVV